jgi:hypothetical protein
MVAYWSQAGPKCQLFVATDAVGMEGDIERTVTSDQGEHGHSSQLGGVEWSG